LLRCSDTRAKIEQLTTGDYAFAKADVDRLRAELGQPPMPSLQETLDERRSQFVFFFFIFLKKFITNLLSFSSHPDISPNVG